MTAVEPNDDREEKSKGNQKSFHIGDIVWAKMESYPFWPAIVRSEKEVKAFKLNRGNDAFPVFFLGTHNFYVIPRHLILPLHTHLDKYKNLSQSKSFKLAIEEALHPEKYPHLPWSTFVPQDNEIEQTVSDENEEEEEDNDDDLDDQSSNEKEEEEEESTSRNTKEKKRRSSFHEGRKAQDKFKKTPHKEKPSSSKRNKEKNDTSSKKVASNDPPSKSVGKESSLSKKDKPLKSKNEKDSSLPKERGKKVPVIDNESNNRMSIGEKKPFVSKISSPENKKDSDENSPAVNKRPSRKNEKRNDIVSLQEGKNSSKSNDSQKKSIPSKGEKELESVAKEYTPILVTKFEPLRKKDYSSGDVADADQLLRYRFKLQVICLSEEIKYDSLNIAEEILRKCLIKKVDKADIISSKIGMAVKKISKLPLTTKEHHYLALRAQEVMEHWKVLLGGDFSAPVKTQSEQNNEHTDRNEMSEKEKSETKETVDSPNLAMDSNDSTSSMINKNIENVTDLAL